MSLRYWNATVVTIGDDTASLISGYRALPDPPSPFWNRFNSAMTAPACLSALEVIREQGLVQWARLGLNEFCGLLELLDGQLFHEDFLQTC